MKGWRRACFSGIWLLSACDAGGAGEPPPADAAAGPDGDPRFSCLGQAVATTADDPLRLPGSALVLFAASPHPDIRVELVRESDQVAVAADVTDATPTDYGDPNFELSVPTAGVPFAGHFRLSKDDLPPLLYYEARPRTGSETLRLSIIPTENVDALAYHGGASPRDPALGIVEVWVRDCRGDPVLDASVTMTPAPRRMVYFPLWPEPATPEGPGSHAVGFDVPPGAVEVVVSVPGVGTYPSATVRAEAGAITQSFRAP